MPEVTYDIEIDAGGETYSAKGDLGTTDDAVFLPPNKELSFKKHAALKELAKCAGNINKVFGSLGSLHIDLIT